MGRLIKAASTAFIFILICGGAVFAEDFSAEMVGTGNGQSFSGKIFISKDKVRTEMQGAIAISRIDKNVVWLLMPQQNIYMEQPLDPKTVISSTGKVPDVVSRKFIEDEVIGGRNTKKYRVVYRALGNEAEIFQWVDPSVAIPVKTAAIDGSWSMEYRNIKTGPQSGSIFEVPAGYKKFTVPGMGGANEYRETQSAGNEADSEEILKQ